MPPGAHLLWYARYGHITAVDMPTMGIPRVGPLRRMRRRASRCIRKRAGRLAAPRGDDGSVCPDPNRNCRRSLSSGGTRRSSGRPRAWRLLFGGHTRVTASSCRAPPPDGSECVPPSPPPGGWTLRFDSASAAEGWQIINDQFPGPTRRAFEQLETEPLARSERQHGLHGSQASATVGGRSRLSGRPPCGQP